MRNRLGFLLLFFILPVAALADAAFLQPRGALFSQPSSAVPRSSSPSLFMGKANNSLFAAMPQRSMTMAPARGSQVDRIRDLIGHAESRRHGYDAVQYGATRKPAKRPTAMTIAEIYAWIDATPGQPHAIGRFQFIPDTLRRLVAQAGIPTTARFSPDVQDLLADILLEDAGFRAFREGRMGRITFMNNLSKIWAGLPHSTGKSYYHGYAGNRASMTWASFDAEMQAIFPR